MRLGLRALAVWAVIIAAESVHGVLRVLFLEPSLGGVRARQMSVFTGSALILLVAWLLAGWLGARRSRTLLAIGGAWVVLTVAFEFTLGRLLGLSWERLLADYDPRQGGLMLLGIAFLALAPLLAARLRGLHQTPPA